MAFSKRDKSLKGRETGRVEDFSPKTLLRLQTSDFSQPPYLHKKRARRLFFYFRFLHTCHAERTKQSVTMPAVTSVMASSWLRVRQRANAVRIARKRSLMVFVIKAPKNSDLGLGSIGSRGSKGLVRRKHNEAPQIFDSVSRRRHQKRWLEIFMAHYGKYHRIGTGREPTPWC